MSRYRTNQLTELMARLLHYQDRGEALRPEASFAEVQREMAELPQEIVDRYRSDAKFHSQVTRAVAFVMQLDEKPMCPCGSPYFRVDRGYVPSCQCAADNATTPQS